MPVPPGSNNVHIVAVGAGGGSALAPPGSPAGMGGAGRNVTSIQRFPNGTAYLRVTVGAPGYRTPGANYSAATGGEASSVAALDAEGNVLALLVMAGGGGGGGVARNYR